MTDELTSLNYPCSLLKTIFDIYPFIITMVIGKGVGHADKVLATAVQVR